MGAVNPVRAPHSVSGAPQTTVAGAFPEIFRETGTLIRAIFMHAEAV
jgi:hypothetical protein